MPGFDGYDLGGCSEGGGGGYERGGTEITIAILSASGIHPSFFFHPKDHVMVCFVTKTYAETPMFSRTAAVCNMACAVVKLN